MLGFAKNGIMDAMTDLVEHTNTRVDTEQDEVKLNNTAEQEYVELPQKNQKVSK
jgi:hypothetical protein